MKEEDEGEGAGGGGVDVVVVVDVARCPEMTGEIVSVCDCVVPVVPVVGGFGGGAPRASS